MNLSDILSSLFLIRSEATESFIQGHYPVLFLLTKAITI